MNNQGFQYNYVANNRVVKQYMGRMESKKNTPLVPYRYKKIEQNGSD